MPCKGRQAEGEFQSSSLFFAFHASAFKSQFDARMGTLLWVRAPRRRLHGGPGRSPGVFCTLCHETKCGPRPRPERASLRTQCANGKSAGQRSAVEHPVTRQRVGRQQWLAANRRFAAVRLSCSWASCCMGAVCQIIDLDGTSHGLSGRACARSAPMEKVRTRQSAFAQVPPL